MDLYKENNNNININSTVPQLINTSSLEDKPQRYIFTDGTTTTDRINFWRKVNKSRRNKINDTKTEQFNSSDCDCTNSLYCDCADIERAAGFVKDYTSKNEDTIGKYVCIRCRKTSFKCNCF